MMDENANDPNKVLDAWIYGSCIILPVKNWKEVREYERILFFRFGFGETPFQQLSRGDDLLLTEKDDFEEVKTRVRCLLAKYVRQDMNVSVDLFFVYGNVERWQ